MTDVVSAATSSLHALRNTRSGGVIRSGERIAPGVWIDLDSEGAAQTAFEAGGAALLQMRLEPSGVGRWCTLNIDLGRHNPGDTALLGVAIRSRAPRSTTARLAVRSFLPGGGHEDSFFPDYLVAFGEESTHCDVLWLAREPALQAPAEWRTLMLFLDPEGFDIAFLDIRLFAA
ncbi:hypothetical protein [Pararhodobacter sp.]|jgi:hypothetical protein|uniref:hypothetical protein n=1 Tax=Pararhodobacter sp. TaxID=2127056 RepID=UPI002FDD92AD